MSYESKAHCQAHVDALEQKLAAAEREHQHMLKDRIEDDLQQMEEERGAAIKDRDEWTPRPRC